MNYQEGPYLVDALLCEHVLEEKDGVKSAIRIVDRVIRAVAHPNPPKEMAPFQCSVMLLIRLKSGNVRGVHALVIKLVTPSGASESSLPLSLNFEGEEDKGIDIVSPVNISIHVAGIYWFELYFDDDFLTRVPLRVVYIPQVTQTSPRAGSGSLGGETPKPQR